MLCIDRSSQLWGWFKLNSTWHVGVIKEYVVQCNSVCILFFYSYLDQSAVLGHAGIYYIRLYVSTQTIIVKRSNELLGLVFSHVLIVIK